MSDSRTLFRNRQEHQHNKVTFIELFFDLVFVFAITQLSHLLIGHFSFAGAIQTLLLMVAVWWVWIFTSWVTNWLDPDRLPVRMVLLIMMVLGLIMSASIPLAFESRGLAFAIAYASMQVGRSAFFMWAARDHPVRLLNFRRITLWLGLAGLFWIAGGLAQHRWRFALWAVALGLEFISPLVYFWVPRLGRSSTDDWDIEGAHMAERCGLFIIIALGESILVTGATFSELDWDVPVTTAFILSLIASFAMWWLYFDVGAEIGSNRIARSKDPGRLARLAYTYIHLFMVAGIIVAAVSDEFVLHHPLGHADTPTIITVLAGGMLYLIGNLLFKTVVVGHIPWSHFAGVGMLALLIPAAHSMTPLALSACEMVVLVAIAVWERVVCRVRFPEESI